MTAALQKLKRWFTRKGKPRPAPASFGPPPALLERYLQYKRLLAANSAILTTVADLQVKMDEGFLFDMYYVRQACDRLGQEVTAMVAALNAMSQNRYRALEAARERVARLVAEELAGPTLKPVPLALPLAEVREGLFFGGKAEKVGELTRLGLQVPGGFGISAYAQKLFFETGDLEKFIREAIAHSHIRDLESLREAGEAIRTKIMDQPLPPELSEAIQENLAGLSPSRLAVRSSALQEDSFFSFAGQFESVLNVPPDLVEQRYKEVIASQFTPRALYYCHTSGFSYQELAMGVLVMEMVAAKSAGVLYTDDPRGGEGAIINAVSGLGSLAVGGVVEPDIYRIEAGRIVARHVGDKTHMHVAAPEGGILDVAIPEELRGPCLEDDQALALAKLGNQVKEHFGLPQDIEWALDNQGRFYLLQARPLRVSRQLKADYLPPRIKGAQVLLSNGIIASRGAASGPVHLLQGESLNDIPKDAVLVTSRALPEYGVVVGRVAAVVSEAGSATSHLATVLREAHIPALFGAKEAGAKLAPGEVVTVDAYYGNIYAGRVEELLKAPRGGGEMVRQTRAYKVLERVLKHVIPLNLLDPRAENFRPESCRTYHDITRFGHEKAMEELFQVSAGRFEEEGARRLVSSIPLELNIIDLGGGLTPEAADLAKVRPEHLQSRPMLAYWRGVSAVGWTGPKPVDLAGFMSVVMSTATDTNIQERLHEKNFAIITNDYMNLSNRLGFHFATIEAFLGAPGENYVSFTFYGGGAELPRRMRRVRFLTRVLDDLGFRVEPKEDSITARIDGYDADVLEEKLEILGRLMMVAKQLDMVMISEDAVEQYYQEFSESHLKAAQIT
ncbi:MAG: PEP/pyruvate-binding domain-containing protein [Thermodesulfobacteriota bacterium]